MRRFVALRQGSNYQQKNVGNTSKKQSCVGQSRLEVGAANAWEEPSPVMGREVGCSDD